MAPALDEGLSIEEGAKDLAAGLTGYQPRTASR